MTTEQKTNVWQVYASTSCGVTWHKENGWVVTGDNYAEALANAKRDQHRGGGTGALCVERIYEGDTAL